MSVSGELRKEASEVEPINLVKAHLVQRPARERCVVSGFNPNDPLAGGDAGVRPAFEIFKAVPHAGAARSPKSSQRDNKQSAAQTSAEKPTVADRIESASAADIPGNEEPANGTAAGSSATLKIPMQAQITLTEEMQRGQRDIQTVALEILQSNFRWPGHLQIESPGPEQKQLFPIAAEKTAIPLQHRGINFGTLALAGSAKSARVTAQLQQAAAWLTAMLVLNRNFKNLRRLADTDELSGAYNRRYFMENVPHLLDHARRDRFCVTILLFDIDDFKQYNDQFGHAAGDAIIREVIRLLRHCTRNRDLVARVGGDEFAVVFWDEGGPRQPDSQHPRTVLNIAQRFRKAVAEHPWNAEGGPISGRLSISGGLATFPWDAQNLTDLLAVADGELMRAKSLGKNAIVLAGPMGVTDESDDNKSAPGGSN
ncbi:MAG: GGDEF domain-containing protein [Phycisphaerae bacterium]